MYSNFLQDISKGKVADVRAPIVDGYPLLRTENINAIAVDGGNRKWVGTNNGLFLVSKDGEAILEHYTTDNSPIYSNIIYDIAIDNLTGEIFVATLYGVISLRGTATQAAETCKEVQVFPNPVFTDYQGTIAISGLAAESTVKITTISGLLVREITSEGGTATWDGYDIKGQKVATGIYLALSAQKDGKNTCVGKFAVIQK
jgi:hypothetical protein